MYQKQCLWRQLLVISNCSKWYHSLNDLQCHEWHEPLPYWLFFDFHSVLVERGGHLHENTRLKRWWQWLVLALILRLHYWLFDKMAFAHHYHPVHHLIVFWSPHQEPWSSNLKKESDLTLHSTSYYGQDSASYNTPLQSPKMKKKCLFQLARREKILKINYVQVVIMKCAQ